MKVYEFFIAISFFIVAYFVNFNIALPLGTSNHFPRVGASGKCNHPNVTFGRRVFGDWYVIKIFSILLLHFTIALAVNYVHDFNVTLK